MKEAISGVPIFEIVVAFILLFTGIMCLTINHTKAFGVKDEIINIIETENIDLTKNNELDTTTVNKIIDALSEIGYRTSGDCPDDTWVGYNRNGSRVSNGRNAAFCVRAVDVEAATYKDLNKICSDESCMAVNGGLPKMVYYDIALFYQLDIPLVTAINFRIYGSTRTLIR